MSDVFVGTGQYAVSRSPNVMSSDGVGSCVILCLYDKDQKIGGIAHIMLSKRPEGYVDISRNLDSEMPARFANPGVGVLVQSLISEGAELINVYAKILGGAEMFKLLRKGSISIGETNINAVKEELAKYNIPIESEDVGGNAGRAVTFYLDSGDVIIKKKI